MAVASQTAGTNLNALVKATHLPRSSAHRIASALCGARFLSLDSTGLYTFGPAFQDLIKRSLTADNRLQFFQPALQYLAVELGETAFFSRYIDGEVNLVHAITPTVATRSYIYPGTGPRPLESCSSSKAILAFARSEEVKQMYDDGRLQLGKQASFSAFVQQLQKVQSDGFAVCDGEIDEGVLSLACPVHVGPFQGLYSIGVVGPTSRMKSMEVAKIAKIVQHAANIAAESLVQSVNPQL